MAVITTYKCDKCGKEWLPSDNSSQPVAIGLVVEFGKTSVYRPQELYAKKCQMWCRECVMRIGIYEPPTVEDKKVAPEIPLTFEEKIIEVLDSLGFIRE